MTNGKQPSKALRRAVKAAFDPGALIDICQRTDFSAYADRFECSPGRRDDHDRFYWFSDNGSPILATAHLDSVQSDNRCSVVDTASGPLACSGALDDRLGAYVILDLLPRLGIVCDVLLTTDEECCDSTADEFARDHDDGHGKPYNWMFSFDRGGTDVVMYEYETKELVALVEASGARVGTGSCSDICCLDTLGVAGFNWGVGYQDYHSSRSHAWIDDTLRMVARFVKFYRANSATTLWHYPEPPRGYVVKASSYGRTPADDDEEDYAQWWRDRGRDYLVADCGHEIDLSDDRTYIDDGAAIVCMSCGTIDQETQVWAS